MKKILFLAPSKLIELLSKLNLHTCGFAVYVGKEICSVFIKIAAFFVADIYKPDFTCQNFCLAETLERQPAVSLHS